MRKSFITVLVTFASCFSLFAQAPSIAITYPETACLNAVQKIQVTINGTYNADNKFAVQIRKGENLPVVSEIPAELVDGKIEVIHADSSLSIPPYVQIRIVTTSPKTESNWYNVIIHTKGIVSLALADSDTINAGEDLLLRFTAFSSSTATVTLNDSSYVTLSSAAGGYFNNYIRKGVNVTTPFYIAHANNVCGAMQVSGQVSATINTTALRTLSVSPAAACEGSEIRVSFATSGPALPAGTRYRLRIAVYQGDRLNAKTVEVPARLEDNVLVANFPMTFNLTNRSEYKLRIVTESPALLGTDSDFSFVVYPWSGATLNTPSRTIGIGETLPVGITFSGIAPYSATLQDGTVISSTQINVEAQLRPEKTTSYTVKSVATGCGTQDAASGPVMVVTVKPGIALDPVGGDGNIFCAGSQARVKMLSNVEFNAATTFNVNAIINNETAYSFPAKKSGDYLEFDIPVLPENVDYSLSYDKISAFYISTTNPTYQSAAVSYYYVISSMPEMVVLPQSVLTYNAPSTVSLSYELRGRGPFEIEDTAGRIYEIGGGGTAWHPGFYVDKSQDFKLKSIRNTCFKNEKLPEVHITFDTVSAPPGIYMQPLDKVICRQDSVEITFMKTGTFHPDNEFHIEGYADCCTFQKLATVSKDGTYKVKVPTGQPHVAYFKFRITSTSPELATYPFEIQMQTPPSGLEIIPAGTPDSPVEYLQGQRVTLRVSSREGGISHLVYSDGVTDHTHELAATGYDVPLNPPVGTVTAYTVKSVRNQCGSFPANLTTYIRVLPYRIAISRGESGFPLSACQGGSLTVPFVILGGDASNATFTLQIARDGTSEFTDLAQNTASGAFTVTVPAHTTTGRYQMRVVSSEGSVSNSVDLVIGASPSAVITSSEKEPIILNPGQSISASVSFTGTAPWTMIYEDSGKETTDNNPYVRYISATQQKDFSLISVYNRCGYGPVSGKVSVKVNPVLSAWHDAQEACAGTDMSVRYQLQGDATLENDYIVFQLVDTQSGKVTGLDSTRLRAGAIRLKIPASLSGDFYKVRCVVRSHALSTTLPVTIKNKVDVSITGNTTINPGESARLLIRSNKPVNEAIHYRLSDGQTGTFYGGSGNSEFYVKVSPAQTTTYSLVSADNGCGEGKKSGSATVEVNPVSERTVAVTKWEPFENSAFCLGDAILVYYDQTGSFSAGNTMTVQFSDTTGRNFESVTTTGTTSPLKAGIPGDFFPGKPYRVRVVASDPGTGSGAYEYPLSPGAKATARFASESLLQDEANTYKLVVALTGTGPWEYDIGSTIGTESYYTGTAIDTVYLRETTPARYYKLLRVANRCGTGAVEKPDIVTVEVITGNPEQPALQVIVAPNPAEGHLKVTFPDTSRKTIRLLNAAGIPVLEKLSFLKEEELTIAPFASGIYILSIESSHFNSVHKIIKR